MLAQGDELFPLAEKLIVSLPRPVTSDVVPVKGSEHRSSKRTHRAKADRSDTIWAEVRMDNVERGLLSECASLELQAKRCTAGFVESPRRPPADAPCAFPRGKPASDIAD